MAKTRAEIQFKVLSILVGGDVGQNPSAEDADTINGYIDSVVDELNMDGSVVYVPDPNQLDDGLFLSFCKLVANAAADEFGAKPDEAKAQQYRNRIRTLVRQTAAYGPAQVDFF